MSDKSTDQINYERVRSRARNRVRSSSWLRYVIYFVIGCAILSAMFSASRHVSPFGTWWFWMFVVFGGVVLLARSGMKALRRDNGDKLDEKIDRAVQKEMARERRHAQKYAAFDDLDDLFEKPKRTMAEKPKRVARLGDDGELIYEMDQEEPRYQASGRES